MRLQPLVKLGDEVLLGALALMREFVAARPDQQQLLATSPLHSYTYLAAGAAWLDFFVAQGRGLDCDEG